MSLKHLIIIVLVVIALIRLNQPGIVFKRPPGILVPELPQQSEPADNKKWTYEGFLFTPLADYNVRARVVSSKHYWFGDESDLSPVDLVLAWNEMSDTKNLEQITFSQGGRFYYWRTKEPPLPISKIAQNSANTHMIPSTARIRKKLKQIDTDDIVTIRGKLVRIDRPDGWHWVSSTTRNDTGAGACEVLWIDYLNVEHFHD